MPRNGRKHASQLQNKHETGNVPPFQKSSKQTSNGYLSNGPEGTSRFDEGTDSATTTQTQPIENLPEAQISKTSAGQRANGYENPANGAPKGILPEIAHNDPHALSTPNSQTHHNIDVSAVKESVVQDSSLTNIANTIVRSWPLGDTIAILIFLLSLPSTILTLTNVLFAILTFVPPGGSLTSLPKAMVDVFEGAGGTPTLLTICMVDVLGFMCWLLMWNPIKDLMTELSQAIVATTLGGSNAVKNRASSNTLFCMAVVTITHFARRRWIPARFFGYDWSIRLASLSTSSSDSPVSSGTNAFATRSATSWFQHIIALHVLSQGVLLMVRRRIFKNQSLEAAQQRKTQAGAANAQSLTGGSVVPSPGFHTPPANEPRSKTSMTNLREAKGGVSKKKRKQATLVRLQQPLWSAVAATKVTVVREIEQSNTIAEASEANAIDTTNLGNASFSGEEGRIWLTQVQATGFSFGANLCKIEPDQNDDSCSSCASASCHDSESDPCRVLINGTEWTSVRFEQVRASDQEQSTCGQQWKGEIFGLSPSMTYQCLFVCSIDRSVMHIASITTPSTLASELQSNPFGNGPVHHPRPSSPASPATTLKASIVAMQHDIEDRKETQKTKQKEQKSAKVGAKKENDALESRIEKIGGEEKTLQARQMQWQYKSRQAEESIAAITEEINLLENIPEAEQKHWNDRKAAYETAKNYRLSTRQELLHIKERAQQEKKSAETDASGAHQKREKLYNRGMKLAEQRERLQSATQKGLSEKERREAERLAQDAEERRTEQQITRQQAQLTNRIEDLQQSIRQIHQQTGPIENFSQQQHVLGAVGERTSHSNNEVSHPIHGYQAQAQAFRFPNGVFAPLESPPARTKSNTLRLNPRNRSGSTASNYSSLGDFYDQDPAPPLPQSRAWDRTIGRQRSTGSGSGSGSGSASSPTVSNGARMSPVGQRSSPRWK